MFFLDSKYTHFTWENTGGNQIQTNTNGSLRGPPQGLGRVLLALYGIIYKQEWVLKNGIIASL